MQELLIVFLFFYFIPTIVAVARSHQSRMAIFMVNLLFGWQYSDGCSPSSGL